MQKVFLIGDGDNVKVYIDTYIREKKFLPYHITIVEDILKVEGVRKLNKTLAIKPTASRLYIFTCEYTLSAQNALLKSVEECDDLTHFIFVAKKEDALLPTLRSRCLEIHVRQEVQVDEVLCGYISSLAQKEKHMWEELEIMHLYLTDKNLDLLCFALRKLLLENYNEKKAYKYFLYLKNLLRYSRLADANNVNKMVILERIFAY